MADETALYFYLFLASTDGMKLTLEMFIVSVLTNIHRISLLSCTMTISHGSAAMRCYTFNEFIEDGGIKP